MTTVRIIFLYILIIFTVILCLFRLGNRPLEKWDEQTNAIVVSELINSSRVWDLTYHHEPFLEKPPLWYWVTTIISKILGMNSFSLRFISAISGLGIVIVIYLITMLLYSKTAALYSILIILSTGQLFINNAGGYFATHNFRSADLDALQLFFILLSYLFMIFSEYKNRKYLICFVICISLAYMTKGQMAFIGIITWIIYKIVVKQKFITSLADIFISFICSLGIIAPWYIAMINKYNQLFIYNHFVYHFISRISTPLEGHKENIFFYLIRLANPRVFLYLLPLICGIIFILIKKKYYDFKYFIPTFSVLSIFLIINITQTKLTWYLLGIYPFAAIILGGLFSDINIYLIKSRKLLYNINYSSIFNVLVLIYSFWGIINNFRFIVK
jgi:4-amino-4-deoxy-L-arabinose transferase-like glycosyltransferase